ncbi:EamA family transporter RarD [Allosphingosinicella flava]|uniref:EamA family transporter RarD n=1 Tax=Allosphingosinicella flava TaxID=2771430 RepID=A0A7T2GJ63_9SPHN|nr:EamA family transporter RarD [Sphingosinicella flava]QPQ54853.1 EamA family transporter RarD [Sphingosinicella flava]
MTSHQNIARSGLWLGVAAYTIWGFLPAYFKLLAHVDPAELVAHRILWSLLFLAALLSAWKRWPKLAAALRTPKVVAILALTALLIGVNWLIYIWAVVNGHVLAGSLGYYLNPLVNILLGVAVLKERLTRPQMAAVALAGAGVAILAAGAGEGLWISLTLAFSFASYGLLRKIAPVEAVEGLSIETLILTPIALAWVMILQTRGTSGLGMDMTTTILLILSGAVTAIPLLLFTAAAKRLPYSTLGFLQYIAPSLQFLLAVFAYGERLTAAHMICFGLIWTALAIFAADGIRLGRRAKARAEAAAGL